MKSIIYIKLLICCVFIFETTISFSQEYPNPILGKFSIIESKGNVYLDWQIIAGSTCNGIQIFHSTDNINFKQIGSIDGVCGSSYEPRDYNFTDNNPVKNKNNYYRLELGGSGASHILSVEIIDIESGYQIRPNPVSDNAKLYFDNNTGQLFQLGIYNLKGERFFNIETRRDFFDLNTEKIQSGIYFFAIRTEDNLQTAKGRIIVQH